MYFTKENTGNRYSEKELKLLNRIAAERIGSHMTWQSVNGTMQDIEERYKAGQYNNRIDYAEILG